MCIVAHLPSKKFLGIMLGGVNETSTVGYQARIRMRFWKKARLNSENSWKSYLSVIPLENRNREVKLGQGKIRLRVWKKLKFGINYDGDHDRCRWIRFWFKMKIISWKAKGLSQKEISRISVLRNSYVKFFGNSALTRPQEIRRKIGPFVSGAIDLGIGWIFLLPIWDFKVVRASYSLTAGLYGCGSSLACSVYLFKKKKNL